MSDLAVRDLRVGAVMFDICFERHGARTGFEVLRGPKDAVVRRSMAEVTLGA